MNETPHGGNTVTDLMTDDEVCAYLRISKPTLRRFLSDKDSEFHQITIKKIGVQRRWVRESVVAFVNKSNTTTTQETEI